MPNSTNSNLLASTKTKTTQGTTKLIVFEVGRLTLALPIHTVIRIVKGIPVSRSGLNQFGVAHLGETEITVVDLYQRLFREKSPFSESKHNYLIMTQNQAQEVVGIEVPQTPALLEVPTDQVRTLPPSYRRLDTLEIASHVTIIPESEGNRTVFLLDIEQLL